MTQYNVSHSRRWQRTRTRWLTGFLFGCLLPMALCHPQALQRLEVLSERLTQVALQISERVCKRQCRTRLNQVRRQWQRRMGQLLRRAACFPCVIRRLDADSDVLSRRGPPAMSRPA